MSYGLRLADVCLASYFLLSLLLELAALATSRFAIHRAERMRPENGARLLLAVRLLPAALALLGTFALFVPSYLRFERDASEEIGITCTLFAFCGLAMLCAGAYRLAWGLRMTSAIKSAAREDAAQIPSPIFAVVGFLRPRVLISRPLRKALSDSQLEAAMLHEDAHLSAGDNWKRLALLAAPRALFLRACYRHLEENWMRQAEWAANDAAIAGKPAMAIALAEALVSIARISGSRHPMLPVSSLVECNDDLERRVHRLLSARMVTGGRRSLTQRILLPAAPLAAVITLLVFEQASLLTLVHNAMERLAH